MQRVDPASAPESYTLSAVYTAPVARSYPRRELSGLDDEARSRVLNYIVSRLDIDAFNLAKSTTPDTAEMASEERATINEEQAEAPKYASFAELHDAAQPTSNAEKALVAGYWLQVCQGSESFDGQSANRELKNLGHGIENITNAINALKGQKPALALQLKKSGKSQQARKTYKITVAGMKVVESMING